MKKMQLIATMTVLTTAILTGCAGTDVVLKYSPASFESIVNQYPDLITDNTMTDHYYSLTVDGETKLQISHDYSLTGSDDIEIVTPIKPFTDSGLNPSKLGDGYRTTGDALILTADYGTGSGMKDTVTDSLFESVKSDRAMLTYHQKLDHYGIKMTAGKFEWAKDYKTNDKDIVFVIRAQPLKDLGVDVQNIAGWTFTTVQDTDGSNVDVLLKAYNLG